MFRALLITVLIVAAAAIALRYVRRRGASLPRCTRPVRVKTPYGVEKELIPKGVWLIKGVKLVKIGLFYDPETGKYFRAKVPDDYPECR